MGRHTLANLTFISWASHIKNAFAETKYQNTTPPVTPGVLSDR